MPDKRFADRLRGRMIEMGYALDDGRPDVYRFCETLGFRSSYVYRWLQGQLPRPDVFLRLALTLGLKPEELVPPAPNPRRARKAGVGMIAALATLLSLAAPPSAQGSTGDRTLVVENYRGGMALIRRRRSLPWGVSSVSLQPA